MPETTEYLNLGMGAIAVLMGVFLFSMFQRMRSFRQMLTTLDELERE
jgi:hypothetical protein